MVNRQQRDRVRVELINNEPKKNEDRNQDEHQRHLQG